MPIRNPLAVEYQDESIRIKRTRVVDFQGDGVVVTPQPDKVIVTIAPSGGAPGVHTIGGAAHSDATVVAPEDMEVLAYQASTSLFKNLKLHGTLLKKTDFIVGGTLELPVSSMAEFNTHVGSAGAHHTKYTNVEAQAIADTQVSIHAAIVGIHHSPTHNLGGSDHNPDTWSNLKAKISDIATVSAIELEYINGLTSAIQTQLDARISKILLTTLNDIIVRDATNPSRVNIAASRIVARLAAGNVAGQTIADVLGLMLTTKGDLLTYGATPQRKAIGVDNEWFGADSAQADGMAWNSWRDADRLFELFTDRRFVADAFMTYDMWASYVAGNGTFLQDQNIAFVDTTTTTGSAARQNWGSNQARVKAGAKLAIKAYVVDVQAATTGLAFIGLIRTSLLTIAQTTKVLTEKHAGLFWENGTWYASSADGTTQETTDVDASMSDLGWLRMESDGTDLKFYWENVLIATHSTNLPESFGYVEIFVNNNAGADKVKIFFYNVEFEHVS